MEDHNRPVTGYPASNPNGYPPNPPPSGTAYPYAAAAPPPNPYYGYPNNPYHHPRRSTFSRRFLAFTIGLIVVLGAVTLIIWLVLRPQVPQFRVDSVTLSNLTVSDNSLVSFTSQVRLTARNPNRRLTLAYDRLDAAVYYRSWSLADTVLPPFSLGTKSETQLTANFSSVGNFVERVAADGMNRERGSRGSIGLNLRVLSRVRFRTNAWRTRVRLLQVFCGDLEVGVPSNGRQGTLTGGPRRCRVVV
ncbi:Late embryogenesis abundant (LEA) hydroxyproline-rich glycoprotein family [Striga hermonthica]|uniref:Late embryogenesis abundant (LEA) hydroxyproline-rich glycoprotein family n=1 Tax=Striga hermonthica TaxID=68872 RepID=A0A9N7N8E8_STRHE|nr:Late embryogenesis abundant (LEA) hydroxyproline-rich glycoprotein family [Striga hermonthica]